MGKTTVLANEECENKGIQLHLAGKKPEDPAKPGTLVVALTVRRNMDTF